MGSIITIQLLEPTKTVKLVTITKYFLHLNFSINRAIISNVNLSNQEFNKQPEFHRGVICIEMSSHASPLLSKSLFIQEIYG